MANVQWLHRGELTPQEVGGKGASLSRLMAAGFSVPLGFAVTANGYRQFLESSGLDDEIAALLAQANLSEPAVAQAVSRRLEGLCQSADLGPVLRREIEEAYIELASSVGVACAVRSSATAEDGANASFAGLYDSFLNLRDVDAVLDGVRRCYSSLWSERALQYRAWKGVGQQEAMAVVVMGLVPAETSGIAFTVHPVTGETDRVVLNASWGLGEAIVSGRVTPDSFVIQKGSAAILEREIANKAIAILPEADGGGTREHVLPLDKANAPSITDDVARFIAATATEVERKFGGAQDIEWAINGGDVYLLQARPVTTLG